MSEFRKEIIPQYSAQVRYGAKTFEERLREAVDKRSVQGTQGLGDFKPGGTGGYHIDRTIPLYRDFHMSDGVFKLACDMDAKGYGIDPVVYAAWMSNSEINDNGSVVKFSVTCDFIRKNVMLKYHDLFQKFFPSKLIKYEVSSQLRKRMHQEA